MREYLDEANRAPMIERPRWTNWAMIMVMAAITLALMTAAIVGKHH